MKYIFGKQHQMTQVFDETGARHPATPVEVSPLTVVSKKTTDSDGYSAYVLGYGSKKAKHTAKPQQQDQFETEDGNYFKEILEYRLETDDDAELEAGETFDVSNFEVGDAVNVSGVSKGKGFQGVVKRHGFGGGRRTHGGQKSPERGPGSIGATGPKRVLKGTKMAGRMGGENVTVQNLEVVHVDADEGILYIRGGLPGPKGSYVEINGEKN